MARALAKATLCCSPPHDKQNLQFDFLDPPNSSPDIAELCLD